MIPHSRPTFGPEEKRACARVLDSCQIAQGEKVAEFERGFCRLTGRRYAIAVNSGSAALSLALRALGIEAGHEVIVPSYNCAALLHALDSVGASARVVDIDPDDYNLSVLGTRRALSRKIKAVIVPYLFGRAARIREFLKLGLPVIEDGTQSLGAHDGGRPVGSFGEISIFSFYATKMITTGEGGMLLTDSGRLAGALRDMRDYDKKERYGFRTNSKMTDLQAAIGIEQLKKLPSFIRARRKIARNYDRVFAGLNVTRPCADRARDHVYFRYVLAVRPDAGGFLRKLRRAGIDAKRPVFKPLHRYLGLPDGDFLVTARAMREVCSVPIYPAMNEKECGRVIRAVREAAAVRK